MKKVILLMIICPIIFSCSQNKAIVEEIVEVEEDREEVTEVALDVPPTITNEITWHSMEQGMKLAAKENKKVFVDVYTDWCGWCKKMDLTTFKDPEVVKYMNANYISVKFNAEQKEDLEFNSEKYVFVPSNKRGYHQLAAVLLDNQLGYPSFAILSESGDRLKKLVGYQQPVQLLTALKSLN